MGKEILYREISLEQCTDNLLEQFIRHQVIDKSLKLENGKYVEIDLPYEINWDDSDKKKYIEFFRRSILKGYVFLGAFQDGILKGLALVEGKNYGKKARYINLCKLHVSEDCRGKGIGKTLFKMALEEARKLDGQKMFISANSSKESMEFYDKLGCTQAMEIVKIYEDEYIEDCHLEILL